MNEITLQIMNMVASDFKLLLECAYTNLDIDWKAKAAAMSGRLRFAAGILDGYSKVQVECPSQR